MVDNTATATTKILNKNGEEVQYDTLKDVPVLAYYFSAHWCPPCRKFTPTLAELYNKWNPAADSKKIEIVFCSLDREESQYKDYYATMPWLTLGFGDPNIKKLMQKFDVQGIPTLAIITKDGKEALLSDNGYEDVNLKKEKAIDEWTKLY